MRGERAHLQTVRTPRPRLGIPPAPTRLEDLDPHNQPDTALEAAQRAQWLADETPGLDESHCIYGHPNYTPGEST